MKTLLILCSLFFTTIINGQNFKIIKWEDLTVKLDYYDPFKDLTLTQLFNLSQIALIRETEESQELSKSELARKDSLEQLFKTENIDVDLLLSMRYEVAVSRSKELDTVNISLNNKKIVIGGYLLPLNYINQKVTEFLIVPWVGACIHTPPPPRNQLIYLKTKEGIEVKSRFQAVKVEGTLTTEDRTSSLFLVDGSSDITSGYSILDGEVINLN
jgi:uncharacterized protein